MARPELSPQQNDVQRVSTFLREVWEHPLLDDDTRRHREEGKAALQRTLAAHGLTDSQVIGIPVKGYLWSMTDLSDYDFRVIATDSKKELFDDVKNHITDWIHLNDVIGPDELVDVKHHGEKLDVHPAAYDLLLTPDEFIVGDLTTAQSLRITVADRFHDRRLTHNYWTGRTNSAQAHFQAQYMQWGIARERIRITAPRTEGTFPHVSKHARFEQLIFDRSQLEPDPEGWEKAFMRSLRHRELPPLAVYRRALKQTQGALSIAA
jgi:hypothetical protein